MRPEVVRTGERQNAAAMSPGAGDAELHRLRADDLPVALASIQREQRAGVHLDVDGGVGDQPALGDGIDVARQHSDPVGVVAGEVRQHQVVRDLPGLGRRTTGRHQNRRAVRAEDRR